MENLFHNTNPEENNFDLNRRNFLLIQAYANSIGQLKAALLNQELLPSSIATFDERTADEMKALGMGDFHGDQSYYDLISKRYGQMSEGDWELFFKQKERIDQLISAINKELQKQPVDKTKIKIITNNITQLQYGKNHPLSFPEAEYRPELLRL